MVDFIKYLTYLLCFYFIVSVFFSSFIGMIQLLRVYFKKREYVISSEMKKDSCIPVSIILPVVESEQLLADKLSYLLELDYPVYEVVMVYDGSDEMLVSHINNTYSLVEMHHPIRQQLKTSPVKAVYEGDYKNISITLVHKVASSFGDAINVGFNLAKYPYVLPLCDKIGIQVDGVKKLMYAMFSKPNMIACGGFSNILPSNTLTKRQRLERFKRNIMGYSKKPSWDSNIKALWLLKKEIIFDFGGFNSYMNDSFSSFMKLFYDYCWERELDQSIMVIPENVGIIPSYSSWSSYFFQGYFSYSRLFFFFSCFFLFSIASWYHVFSFWFFSVILVVYILFQLLFPVFLDKLYQLILS